MWEKIREASAPFRELPLSSSSLLLPLSLSSTPFTPMDAAAVSFSSPVGGICVACGGLGFLLDKVSLFPFVLGLGLGFLLGDVAPAWQARVAAAVSGAGPAFAFTLLSRRGKGAGSPDASGRPVGEISPGSPRN